MAKEITLMFDSSCGYTQKEIISKGGAFIPILVDINGNEYKSGINLTTTELEKIYDKNTKIKTAACTLGDLEKVFEETLKKSKKVFYISLSKALSSTNQTAKMLSESDKFKGKVFVYDSLFISIFTRRIVDKIFDLVDNQKYNEKELSKWLDQYKNGKMIGWLVPESLEFLYRGGRITKLQYTLGSLFRIIPIIPAIEGAINSGVEKVKSLKKAHALVADKVEAEYKKDKSEKEIIFTYSHDGEENWLEVKKLLIEKGIPEQAFHHTILTAEIIAHVGPKYWCIGVMPNIKVNK